MAFHLPDQFRIARGPFRSTRAEHGDNGAGFIPVRSHTAPLKFIASDGRDAPPGERWEHVSASFPDRCPTWAEMCRVVALFWDEEDTVVQLHPPRSTWVNNHPFCLHLWRNVDAVQPLPPEWMVGIRELGTATRKELAR